MIDGSLSCPVGAQNCNDVVVSVLGELWGQASRLLKHQSITPRPFHDVHLSLPNSSSILASGLGNTVIQLIMSSLECKKLLIFGATGLIGSRIIRAVIQNKAKFDRVAIFTSPGTVEAKADEIEGLKKEGVDVIVGDVTKASDVTNAYKG